MKFRKETAEKQRIRQVMGMLVMEEKTRKPETAKQTAKEHHVQEHEDEHQHGNPQFALKVLLILIAIILVIVILKATGVPFAVKDWLSHVTGDMIALR